MHLDKKMKANLNKRLDIFFLSLPLYVQVRLKVLYSAVLYLTLRLKTFELVNWRVCLHGTEETRKMRENSKDVVTRNDGNPWNMPYCLLHHTHLFEKMAVKRVWADQQRPRHRFCYHRRGCKGCVPLEQSTWPNLRFTSTVSETLPI